MAAFPHSLHDRRRASSRTARPPPPSFWTSALVGGGLPRCWRDLLPLAAPPPYTHTPSQTHPIHTSADLIEALTESAEGMPDETKALHGQLEECRCFWLTARCRLLPLLWGPSVADKHDCSTIPAGTSWRACCAASGRTRSCTRCRREDKGAAAAGAAAAGAAGGDCCTALPVAAAGQTCVPVSDAAVRLQLISSQPPSSPLHRTSWMRSTTSGRRTRACGRARRRQVRVRATAALLSCSACPSLLTSSFPAPLLLVAAAAGTQTCSALLNHCYRILHDELADLAVAGLAEL